MSASEEAEAWQQDTQALAKGRGVRYEEVGGINPRGGPVALCPGGSNRITGELEPEFWGASCDAEEREEGGLFRGGRAVVPQAVLMKSHMPDLAKVVPAFNVESLERTAEDLIERNVSRNRVQFESIDFNKRFLATVPKEYDPVALRELFSPGFLDWAAGINRDVDFGISERQIYFLWRLRERTREEYESALKIGGGLFTRVRREMEGEGLQNYPAGPWHAGLEPFPDQS